jgi:hypothetical protein
VNPIPSPTSTWGFATEINDPLAPLCENPVSEEIIRPISELLMPDLLVSTGRARSVRGFKLRCSNPRPPQPDSVVGTTKPLFERSCDGSQYQRRSENLKSWISRILEEHSAAFSELIVPVFPTTSMVAVGLLNTGKYEKNEWIVGDCRG